MKAFADWLAQTPFSLFLQETLWIVPALQSAHILGMALIFTYGLMFNLRLAGGGDIVRSAKRINAVLWPVFSVMVATGVLLIVAEPARELLNLMFWIKMGLLAAALALTAYSAGKAETSARYWREAGRRTSARVIGLATALLLAGIVFCGRWIAYFDVM